MSNNLNGNLEALFDKLENFVTTKTVVGEAILFDNVVIVPLVDVSFGVGAGANEHDSAEKNSRGELGVGGLGAKISPSAVIAISNGSVQMISVNNNDKFSRLIEMVPGLLSKLKLDMFVKKDKDKDKQEEKTVEDDLMDA